VVTRVILVRHGESTYNVEQRVQGHCDESTLTSKGQLGADQVATALQGLQFDAIYASPLRRASETAERIRSRLGASPTIQHTDLLKEVNLPLWEGMLFDEVKAKYPDEYEHWQHSPHTLRMALLDEQGRSVDFYPIPDLYEQAKQVWQAILPHHPAQTILIVAHSGINRALISTALGLGPDRYQAIQQANCGISVLNFKGQLGERVQLESLNLTSHLGDQLPRVRANTKGPRMLLVRHGETDWNRQTRFQGQIDVPLNDNGRSQAQQAAEFLKPVDLQAAFSSPMLRPKETAELILQEHPSSVPLQLRDGLREISHGLWEGKLESEIEAEFGETLQQWRETPATVQMPDGENLQQVEARAIADWQTLVQATADASPDLNTALVVAHDATNKVILCHVLGLGPEYFWCFRQGNGAVSVIDYPQGPDGPAVLQAMNITTHLGGGILDKTAAGAL
jgi:phosphoserine phosphatase